MRVYVLTPLIIVFVTVAALSVRAQTPTVYVEPDRWTKIHLRFPNNWLLSSSTEVGAKVAYANTLGYYSVNSRTAPTRAEVIEHFEAERTSYRNGSSKTRASMATDAVIGIGVVAVGLAPFTGGGSLTAGDLLIASPALLAGGKQTIDSAKDLLNLNLADQVAPIGEMLNRNSTSVLIAGLEHPEVSGPLSEYLLTNTIQPSEAQVDNALQHQPLTESEVDSQIAPMSAIVEGLKSELARLKSENIPVSKAQVEILNQIRDVTNRAEKIESVTTSGRLDQKTKEAVLEDIDYVANTISSLAIAVNLPGPQRVQLNKFLSASRDSAKIALELAAVTPNPLAIASAGASLLSTIFGRDAEGPNPFQLIYDKLLDVEAEVKDLQVQVGQLRDEMRSSFEQLRAMLNELSYQLRASREIILRELDTVLADVRGMNENKRADDWSDFETAVQAFDSGFPYDSDASQLEKLREDRVRSTFVRLSNHIASGKGGLGAQFQSGPENCTARILDEIRKNPDAFEVVASRLASNLDEADYGGQAYCVGALAAEILQSLPARNNIGLFPVDIGAFLPGDLTSDNQLIPLASQRYVIGPPLALGVFLQRIRPTLDAIASPNVRADLIAALLEQSAPALKSFGLLSGPIPPTLLISAHHGLRVNIATDVNQLFFNRYFKIVGKPFSAWIDESQQMFSNSSKMHQALYPYPDSLNAGVMPYDRSRVTDGVKAIIKQQDAELEQKAALVNKDVEKLLGDLINARNQSWTLTNRKVPETGVWKGLSFQPEEAHPGFVRQIISSPYAPIFKSDGGKFLTADSIRQSSDKMSELLFNGIKTTVNCIWYSHPDDRNAPGTSSLMASVAHVSDSCKNDLHIESPQRLQNLSANYVRILTYLDDVYYGAHARLEEGVEQYLRLGGDTGVQQTVSDIEDRIIIRSLAMRVLELQIDRRIAAARRSTPKAAIRNPRLALDNQLKPYLDAVLRHTAAVNRAVETAKGQDVFLSELVVTRPRLQKPDKPPTAPVPVYAFQQYYSALGQYSSSYRRDSYPLTDYHFETQPTKDIGRGSGLSLRVSPKLIQAQTILLDHPAVFNASLHPAVQLCANSYAALQASYKSTLISMAVDRSNPNKTSQHK